MTRLRVVVACSARLMLRKTSVSEQGAVQPKNHSFSHTHVALSKVTKSTLKPIGLKTIIWIK